MKKSYLKIDSPFDRTIVCGDIHGCYQELLRLLDEISFGAGDCFITTGDFLDRGPWPWETATFIKNSANVYSVQGNHERRVAGIIRKKMAARWSQLHTLSLLPESEHDIWADFLEALPVIIETPHAIITHARLDPTRKLENQVLYHAAGVGGERTIIEMNDQGVPCWFTAWQQQHPTGKPVCMGHKAYSKVELAPGKLYALDTAVVKGQHLTAAILPEGRLISIPAAKNYYQISFITWHRQDLDFCHPELWPIQDILYFKQKDALTGYDQKVVQIFHNQIEKFEIESLLNQLKNQLIARFGKYPAQFSERGPYFKNIIDTFQPNISIKLVKYLLSTAEIELEIILQSYAKSDLSTLYEDIQNLL